MEQPEREIQALRERLSRVRQASLRISESLNAALLAVMDGARSLTRAPYDAIIILDARSRWTTTCSQTSIPPAWSGCGRPPKGRYPSRT